MATHQRTGAGRRSSHLATRRAIQSPMRKQTKKLRNPGRRGHDIHEAVQEAIQNTYF